MNEDNDLRCDIIASIEVYNSGEIVHAKAIMEELLLKYPERLEPKVICAQHFLELEDFDRAYDLMKECIQLAPESLDIMEFAHKVFFINSDFEAAVQSALKCIELSPGNVGYYSNLAQAYFKNKQYGHALKVWEYIDSKGEITAGELSDVATCALNLNYGLEKALSYCLRALEMDPASIKAGLNMALLLGYHGEAEFAAVCFKNLAYKCFHMSPLSFSHLYSNYLLSLNYDPNGEYPNEYLFQEHLGYAKKVGKIYSKSESSIFQEKGDSDKLRIGFVSADFNVHPVTFFLLPFLLNYNRDKFEVHLYSSTPSSSFDKMTDRLKELVDGWTDLDKVSDDKAFGLITSDRNDILIDLSGHTAYNRLACFSKRMASCQVSWLGYPNTTGLSEMDFRIVDSVTDPPGVSDQFATEKLVRIDPCFICYSNPSKDALFSPVRLQQEIVFCTFNNLLKISKETLSVWAKILDMVPNSKILFKYHYITDVDVCSYFVDKIQQAGIAPNRTEFLPAIESFDEHLALFNSVDIALDPFPYNGTTSTCDALYMGVPVVALRGDRHAARVSASILTAIGCSEFVAASKEDYVNIAVNLASRPDELIEVKNHVRSAMLNSSVMDEIGFTQRFEKCLVNMYELTMSKG